MKMITKESFSLSNGVEVPKLGLGTWMIGDDVVASSVEAALEIGYRHIDTAQAYANERGVGEAVRKSAIARDEIFVTTKVDASHKTYADAKKAIDGSLQTMGLDHIDLMLIHSPQPWQNFAGTDRYFEGNVEAWRALEEAYAAGKLRAIGVSNFEKVDLENLFDNGSVRPMVNQVLAHVSNTPFDLIDYCQANGILVEAYSPVAHGKILDNSDIAAIADKYSVGIPQLCIRYCVQLGLAPLPKTANPDHMRINASLDFEISASDMEALKNIDRIKHYGDASNFPVFAGKK
jgi:diketogulonate reductase-like aldo/keto reductase